jgi:hypothetical protein
MEKDDSSALENQFNAAFYLPAKFNWKSKRALFHWIDREHLQDYLAGPIYKIVNYGGCDYVYGREDDYFRDIDNPAALRNRLRQWHSQMVGIIDSFTPTSSAEAADLVSMRQFASDIGNVVEAACDIEQRRWESANAR